MVLYQPVKDLLNLTVAFMKWRARSKAQAPGRELCECFLRLFAAQHIQAHQISRVFPAEYNAAPADFISDERLLGRLDERLLSHACDLFGVERGWLDGTGSRAYPLHFCYKNLGAAVELLQRLRASHENLSFYVVKGSDNRLDKGRNSDTMLTFLRGEVITFDDITICRDYVFADRWNWSHPPSRLELKALCWIAWQFGAHPTCINAKTRDIQQFCDGELLCGELIDRADGENWHLDDYIFTDDESCCAKDPEEAALMMKHLDKLGLLQGFPTR